MEVILREDVKALGKAGALVRVKPGYARNFLLPQGLAYEASDREMEYEHLSLDSVAEQQHSRWVRLVPDSITGRRVVRAPSGWQPPILVPDPGLEDWHGGGADRWATEWVQ